MDNKKFPPKAPPKNEDDCEDRPVVPCFTSGSSVVTKQGLKLVEYIVPGDLVLTRDNGYKEVLWSGKAQGTYGIVYNGTIFSPQHKIIQRIEQEEVLVPAIQLVKADKADAVFTQLTYVHFMFEQHEIVCVDNIWSESFFAGDWIMRNSTQGFEISKLFGDVTMELARPVLKFKQNSWQLAA